jgi:hypothetical protein
LTFEIVNFNKKFIRYIDSSDSCTQVIPAQQHRSPTPPKRLPTKRYGVGIGRITSIYININIRIVMIEIKGRIDKIPKGPGLFFILPCTDKMQIIDLRIVA